MIVCTEKNNSLVLLARISTVIAKRYIDGNVLVQANYKTYMEFPVSFPENSHSSIRDIYPKTLLSADVEWNNRIPGGISIRVHQGDGF